MNSQKEIWSVCGFASIELAKSSHILSTLSVYHRQLSCSLYSTTLSSTLDSTFGGPVAFGGPPDLGGGGGGVLLALGA